MISGHVYRRLGENRVEVTLQDGRTGIFDQYAEYIDGEKSADIQMCSWVGGAICEGEEDTRWNIQRSRLTLIETKWLQHVARHCVSVWRSAQWLRC